MQLLQKKKGPQKGIMPFLWGKMNAHKEKKCKKTTGRLFSFSSPKKKWGKWETPSSFCVTLSGWRFVEPLGVCFFRTVQSPGITDGGRVTMLHVLRVGIARKFAVLQNDSTGGQAEKKSETVDASEIWGTPIHMATLPKTNSSHLKHCGWFR